MKFYENIEAERDRIQECISRFGWTSDHNLDWFIDCTAEGGKPLFIGFEDGSGLLVHKYLSGYKIWSDPLATKSSSADKILEFSKNVLAEIKEVTCIDVSDTIRSELTKDGSILVGEIEYSLEWPVLNMELYDPALPGGHFKEVRNAKN